MDMSYDMIQDLYITQDLLAEMVRWFLICHYTGSRLKGVPFQRTPGFNQQFFSLRKEYF